MTLSANFPHTVTLIEPALVSDGRSELLDYGPDSAGITADVKAWVQEYRKSETNDDRDVRTSTYTMFVVAPTLSALARVEWNGRTYDVDSEPAHFSTPRGYHHTEALLKLVEG